MQENSEDDDESDSNYIASIPTTDQSSRNLGSTSSSNSSNSGSSGSSNSITKGIKIHFDRVKFLARSDWVSGPKATFSGTGKEFAELGFVVEPSPSISDLCDKLDKQDPKSFPAALNEIVAFFRVNCYDQSSLIKNRECMLLTYLLIIRYRKSFEKDKKVSRELWDSILQLLPAVISPDISESASEIGENTEKKVFSVLFFQLLFVKAGNQFCIHLVIFSKLACLYEGNQYTSSKLHSVLTCIEGADNLCVRNGLGFLFLAHITDRKACDITTNVVKQFSDQILREATENPEDKIKRKRFKEIMNGILPPVAKNKRNCSVINLHESENDSEDDENSIGEELINNNKRFKTNNTTNSKYVEMKRSAENKRKRITLIDGSVIEINLLKSPTKGKYNLDRYICNNLEIQCKPSKGSIYFAVKVTGGWKLVQQNFLDQYQKLDFQQKQQFLQKNGNTRWFSALHEMTSAITPNSINSWNLWKYIDGQGVSQRLTHLRDSDSIRKWS